MPNKAQITSVEAIESFRSALIIFLGQARPVMEEVGNEMIRARHWVQSEHRNFWDQEMRRRTRKLEEARQELFTARMSKFQDSTALQTMNVQRSERAVQEAESKLRILKKWDRELDNCSAPLLKQVEQMQGFLATDMARAVAYLDQILKTLDAYHQAAAPRLKKTVAAEPVKAEDAK